MTNPFTDLQTALANATGMDTVLCGLLLGVSLTVPLMLILTWVLDPKGEDPIWPMIMGGGIGAIFCYGVGWFPLYIPIFLGLVIAFIIFDPFGSRR